MGGNVALAQTPVAGLCYLYVLSQAKCGQLTSSGEIEK
jgi:hypothetical protein